MKSDQDKWHKRYQTKSYPVSASELVTNYIHLAKIGKALDIAAGNGRNSRFLIKQGFSVDAVDITSTGFELFQSENAGICFKQEDLDFFIIPANSYDLILNLNFLSRRLFPYLITGLKPGGLIIFETFIWEKSAEAGNHDDTIKSDHYLRPNELLHAFLSLHIVSYQETLQRTIRETTYNLASLVAQKK